MSPVPPPPPIIRTVQSIHFVYPTQIVSRAEAYEHVHHELIHRMLTSTVIRTMTNRCTVWWPKRRSVAVAERADKMHDTLTSTWVIHSRRAQVVRLLHRPVCERVDNKNGHFPTSKHPTKKMAIALNAHPLTAGMCMCFFNEKLCVFFRNQFNFCISFLIEQHHVEQFGQWKCTQRTKSQPIFWWIIRQFWRWRWSRWQWASN